MLGTALDKASVLPPLKPIQPTTKNMTPSIASGRSLPEMILLRRVLKPRLLGVFTGIVVLNLQTGAIETLHAKTLILATGGAGRIYRVTTNAVICQGMGHAIALDTGIAQLGNMEAVQFHPTGIFPAGILVTEGCRGDGGLLLDAERHRFMPDYEPEKAELASRKGGGDVPP